MHTSKKVRVLFLNARSEIGGPNFSLLEIIKNLDKSEFDLFVMLPEDGPLVNDLRNAGATILFGKLNPMERPDGIIDILSFAVHLLPTSFSIARTIRRQQVDLVYTNSSAVQAGAIAAFFSRIPHIWHIREIWESPKPVVSALYWFVYHFSDHIITITNRVKVNAFANRNSKITTIYNGIDIQRFEQAAPESQNMRNIENLPADAIVIGMIGRLIPWKGQDLLLKACSILIKEQINIHVVIVGDIPRPLYQSYKDDLYRYVTDNNIKDNVHFIGWSHNIPTLLREFDVLVVPSVRPEPLGNVISEARAAGVPVIASNHGGPSEIINDNENGKLFEPGNEKALYFAIRDLLDNVQLRQRIIDNGGKVVREQFDAAKNVSKIQKIIGDLTR